MDTSLPRVPPELCEAITANGGLPIEFRDPNTQAVDVLTERMPEVTLDQEYLHRELELRLESLNAGKGIPWDPERIKRLGREALAERERGDG